MHRIFASLAAAATLLFLAVPAEAEPLRRVIGQGFSVKMPWPLESVVENNTPGKPGVVRQKTFTSVADDVTYAASSTEYTAAHVESRSAGGIMEDFGKHIMSRINGRRVSRDAMSIGTNPGEHVVITSDGYAAEWRNFMVGRRLYSLFIIRRHYHDPGHRDEFFSSFELRN